METSGRPLGEKLGDVKVVQDGGKTYIIVVKDGKTGIGSGSGQSGGVGTGCRTLSRLTRDSVKRNLANLGDDDDDDLYCTPTADLARVFGVRGPQNQAANEEVHRGQGTSGHSDKLTGTDFTTVVSKTSPRDSQTKHRSEKIENYKVTKRKQMLPGSVNSETTFETHDKKPLNPACLNRKLFASPEPGTQDFDNSLTTNQKTPLNSEGTDTVTPDFARYAYKTPTPELPKGKHAAVRKIFIVQGSPTCPKSSTPDPKNTRKNFSTNIVLTPQRTADNEIVFSPVLNWAQSESKPVSPSLVATSPLCKPSATETEDDSEGTGKSLDESLTNIQWLGALASEGLVPTAAPGVPTGQEIEKVSQECGLHKRPAFSYMMLIRMALNTRHDKRMTLREICKWIEDTFPFYKQTAKPGWKNSIRHNLSVYDIFVRVPSNPKQHGSQWTVRESNAKKSKYSKCNQNKGDVAPAPGVLPAGLLSSLPMLHSAGFGVSSLPSEPGHAKKKKKGPTPILPRPPPSVLPPGSQLQAYALIPISSLNGGLSGANSLSGGLLGTSSLNGGLLGAGPGQPLASQPYIKTEPLPAQTPTQPAQLLSTTTVPDTSREYTCNVIKEAWQTASAMETKSLGCDLDTVEIKQPNKKAKVKPGLPKPKMYTAKTVNRTGTKKAQKARHGPVRSCVGSLCNTPVRNDAVVSGSELGGDIENGLPTPLRQLLDTPVCDSRGTPGSSPCWLSPIPSSTPVRGGDGVGLADGSFLDLLPTALDFSSPTKVITPVKSLDAWMKIAAGLMDTPSTSLLQASPAQDEAQDTAGTESISHLLAEIDPCLVDEIDSSQLHLNWPCGDTNTPQHT